MRKISVNVFTVKDSSDSTFEQKMTHIAIHTVEVDGERTLFRHFLRLPNGSVVEVDDNIGENFSGQLALEKLLGKVGRDEVVVEGEETLLTNTASTEGGVGVDGDESAEKDKIA